MKASESEVIRDGSRSMIARNKAVGTWLANQVLPADEALKKEPHLGISASAVKAKLSEIHKII